jgi:hypothetical protein
LDISALPMLIYPDLLFLFLKQISLIGSDDLSSLTFLSVLVESYLKGIKVDSHYAKPS